MKMDEFNVKEIGKNDFVEQLSCARQWKLIYTRFVPQFIVLAFMGK